MKFDFEISRVDCISKQILLLFQYMKKIHLSHLKQPPIPPLFSARKILRVKGKIYIYAFGLCKQKHSFFPYIQVDNTLIILPWTVFEQL